MLSRYSKCASFVLLLSGFSLFGCLGESNEKDVSVSRQTLTYGGHDYLFVTTPKTWHEAQAYCANYGGGAGYRLVTIDDAAEEAFLSEIEIRRALPRWWMGYSDEGIEGTWTWSNGSSAFVNWAPGQPDNRGNQDCAVDRFNGNDGWDDMGCGSLNPFVCELDSNATDNRGSFSYSALSTNSATVNTAQYAVFLFAGQLFTVGTVGVPGASGVGDTYLRLKNPSGVQIAFNDDTEDTGSSAAPTFNLSNISVVVPTTGTYVIQAGCYQTTQCSGTVAFDY